MVKSIKKWLVGIWKAWEQASEEAHKRYLEQIQEEGCEYCGRSPVCQHCQRCHDSNCNAGCITCRQIPKHDDKCSCCGK